jgi:hypothetical protein
VFAKEKGVVVLTLNIAHCDKVVSSAWIIRSNYETTAILNSDDKNQNVANNVCIFVNKGKFNHVTENSNLISPSLRLNR